MANKEKKTTVLEFNGTYWHRQGASSWDAQAPCSGTYRVNKGSISLFNIAGQKVGVIANSVLARASRLPNGKWFYQYAIPNGIPQYENMRQYNIEVEKAMALLRST